MANRIWDLGNESEDLIHSTERLGASRRFRNCSETAAIAQWHSLYSGTARAVR